MSEQTADRIKIFRELILGVAAFDRFRFTGIEGDDDVDPFGTKHEALREHEKMEEEQKKSFQCAARGAVEQRTVEIAPELRHERLRRVLQGGEQADTIYHFATDRVALLVQFVVVFSRICPQTPRIAKRKPGAHLHRKCEKHHREAQVRHGGIEEIALWRKRCSGLTVHDDRRACALNVFCEYVPADQGEQNETRKRRETRSRGQILYELGTDAAFKELVDEVGTDDGNTHRIQVPLPALPVRVERHERKEEARHGKKNDDAPGVATPPPAVMEVARRRRVPDTFLQVLFFLLEKRKLGANGENLRPIDGCDAHLLAVAIVFGPLHDMLNGVIADLFADVLTTPFWLHFLLPLPFGRVTGRVASIRRLRHAGEIGVVPPLPDTL